MTRTVKFTPIALLLPLLTILDVEAAQYGATYTTGTISNLAAGQTSTVSITVRNTGTLAWVNSGATPYRLSYHWYAPGAVATSRPPSYGAVVWNGLRTDLPRTIAPNTQVTLAARLQAPPSAGSYTLKWDMIHEGVAWFSQQGVPTRDQAVTVVAIATATGIVIALPPEDRVGWLQDRGNPEGTGWHVPAAEPKGEVVWRLGLGGRPTPPVVAPRDPSGSGGTIFVGTDNGARALVIVTPFGTQASAIALQGFLVHTAPAIRSDGSVVVVGVQYDPGSPPRKGKGRVFRVTPVGRVVSASQDFAFQRYSLSAPKVDRNDNTYILIPDDANTRLMKFDRSMVPTKVGGFGYEFSGGMGCIFCPLEGLPFGETPGPPPAIDPVSSRVIYSDSHFLAATIASGGGGWQREVKGWQPAIRGGLIYINTDRGVEARDLNGNRQWGSPMTGSIAIGQSPGDPSRNFVYLVGRIPGGRHGVSLEMIDMRNNRITGAPLEGQGWGTPVVLNLPDGREVVVVARQDGMLQAIRQDGTRLWSLLLGSKVVGSPAVVSGRIYVPTEDAIVAVR